MDWSESAHDRDDDGTTRAIAWLTAWDSQGIHRTATGGDEAGANWLIREATALGAAPEIEEFSLDRLDPIEAYLEFDGRRVRGVPVFDAPATGPDGISGILGRVGEQTPIAVAELSPLSVYTPDYEELRRNAVHRGLVILCKGRQSGLGLLNAERFRHPYGAPAVHVSSEARAEVLAAAARRTSARLVSTSSRVPTRCVQCRRHDPWQGSFPGSGRRHDTAQLVVAIDIRARRRARLLARIVARVGRLPASLRCGLYRQQRA